MKRVLATLLLLLTALSTQAVNRAWTNTLGGDWYGANNWSPTGSPAVSDNALITNNGTYTVSVVTSQASVSSLTLGGSSGTQTLLYGVPGNSPLTLTNSGTVRANGVLTLTNGGLQGFLTVAPSGQLNLNSPAGLYFYNFSLVNQGTVNWTSGAIAVGGSNLQITSISNGGFWQVFTTSDDNQNFNYGGGGRSLFLNGGTFRKMSSPVQTTVNMDFVNLPSGLVDVESGTLRFSPHETNLLGGSFSVTSPGLITFTGGIFEDAGGAVSGTGSALFNGGTFYFRTNIVPGVTLTGGDVYITGNNSFQHAGAITNLTLDGAVLHGTNRVTGTLTVNSGNLVDVLTVQPAGQLLLTTAGSKLLYNLTLNNQGTVTWGGAGFSVGGTPPTIVSNGGLWQLTGDDIAGYGGVGAAYWTNYGTVKKIGGTNNSALSGFQFFNQPSGVVEVDTGTMYLPNQYTNRAGEMRLNGGQFASPGGITLAGGTLDGTGDIVSSDNLSGGTVSPGLGGPGSIGFIAGLTLGSNATFVVNGTGTLPGSQYSQLVVTGAVTLASSHLQVTSLPNVPAGTTFVIITNDGVDAVSGTFNGLAEGSTINVSGQSFQIHYAGGSGNDVTLVRVAGAGGPAISFNGFTNGNWRLSGSGVSATGYTIQATTNFLSWTNVGTITSDGSGNFIFVDTNTPHFHYRFYRTTN